ncbi:MAG: hypothetical protein EXR65_03110 [Dehalococcoidia bacterium]|nr:hypothetical protein [Dehalococcoidia bacterium]
MAEIPIAWTGSLLLLAAVVLLGALACAGGERAGLHRVAPERTAAAMAVRRWRAMEMRRRAASTALVAMLAAALVLAAVAMTAGLLA